MRFLWHSILLSLFVVVMTAFSNCSPKKSSSGESTVNVACGQNLTLTQKQIFQLAEEAHHPDNPEIRTKCPGFFAVLTDDQPNLEEGDVGARFSNSDLNSPSLAFQRKMISLQNNCNQDGPPDEPPNAPPSNLTKEELIKSLLEKTKPDLLLQNITTLSNGSLWPTRYHTSASRQLIGDWLVAEMKKIAGNRSDISIRLVSHKNTPQPTVEAIIQGTGPNKSKFAILGAHIDSINGNSSSSNPNASAPGADDNASGTASILEAFRVIVESGVKPDASIAFYGYAAEEAGLIGSQEIARSYANAKKEVLGVMQLDMDSFATTDSTDEIIFITDFTSPQLTTLATDLAKNFINLKVGTDKCGYGCSDHASWNQLNYHAVMPAEKEVWTSVKRIHTINDIVDNKTKPKYADKFVKLSIAFLIHLGYR